MDVITGVKESEQLLYVNAEMALNSPHLMEKLARKVSCIYLLQ